MENIDKLAQAVAEAAAPHADRHDREGSFVEEGVAAARDLGYLAAPVPAELGGAGALTADIASSQRILARACGSTALACSMHLHLMLASAWRWRRGLTIVEPLLLRVLNDRIVVGSTGGSDWANPSAIATPVDGGWKVNGRKIFSSISPAATMVITFAAVRAAEPGAEVIAFGLPLSAEGVHIEKTWDAVGMRGTASDDIVLEDVFVAEAQVSARRTWGELDAPLLVASLHAFPAIYATYLGIAEGLVDTVLDSGKVGPGSARLAGETQAELQRARWALEGALAGLGDDPEPTLDNYAHMQALKWAVTTACQRIATLAAELAGGGSYARRGPVDRMIRDLRAAPYHVTPPEIALVHAGQQRLGLPIDPV